MPVMGNFGGFAAPIRTGKQLVIFDKYSIGYVARWSNDRSRSVRGV